MCGNDTNIFMCRHETKMLMYGHETDLFMYGNEMNRVGLCSGLASGVVTRGHMTHDTARAWSKSSLKCSLTPVWPPSPLRSAVKHFSEVSISRVWVGNGGDCWPDACNDGGKGKQASSSTTPNPPSSFSLPLFYERNSSFRQGWGKRERDISGVETVRKKKIIDCWHFYVLRCGRLINAV